VTAILDTPRTGPRRGSPVVRALARLEARRMLRNPVLYAALLLWAQMVQSYGPPDPWRGADYEEFPLPLVPLHLATAVLVALAFHRERSDLGVAAPTGESHRATARLTAALLPVGVTVLAVAATAVRVRSLGGFDLGDEPGNTPHAYPTLGEWMQPVAGAILAVGVGAAAGRWLGHRLTVLVALSTGYFLTSVYWIYTGPLAPYSILQSQPVYVDLGPGAGPLTLPDSWLLRAPGEFQTHWARLVVSEPLAWWHNGWLLGLAAVFLALVVSRPWRRRLAVAGAVLAVGSVIAQTQVYPG
jgi:hypothetical protein